MDGFEEDESERQGDDTGETLGRLLAPEGDALEALQLAERLFDPSSAFIHDLGEELRPVLGIRLGGDRRADAACSRRRPVGFGIIAFVGQGRAWHHVGPDVEQHREHRTVASLASGQMEGEREAVEVGLEMDLGREPTP